MQKQDLEKYEIPNSPGVYLFKGKKGEVYYVGKAANLRQRIKSYFQDSDKLALERGRHIVQMVKLSSKICTQPTSNVLEAVILEANLIKKYQPAYNTKEKSNKSFNFVVITNEEFPKIKLVRGKDISNISDKEIKYLFGPFPEASVIKKALKIIRKIFPFSDSCSPGAKRACFYNQIGLCPGVCISRISKQEYVKIINNIKLFFEGKKEKLIKNLEKQMKEYAKRQEYEKAAELRDQIFALEKVEEASLIEEMYKTGESAANLNIERIEGYDVSHTFFSKRIGAMVVYKNGEFSKKDYRWMYIKTDSRSDQNAIKEIITRRMKHKDWEYPQLIVVDGGATHLKAARQALIDLNIKNIHVVSVVKDEKHKPKAILGSNLLKNIQKNTIKKINEESHRFALTVHKRLRDKINK